MNENSTCDFHGRSSLLGSYVQFQCLVPRPHKALPSTQQQSHTPSSNDDCFIDIYKSKPFVLIWVNFR